MSMKQEFFKLLAHSNELKKNHKYLHKEDTTAFEVLLKFLVIISGNYHYSEKQEYINLAKDFLADEIEVDDFAGSFMAIYEGIGKELNQMETDESAELANFLTKTNRNELSILLTQIYGACDGFFCDAWHNSNSNLEPDFSMSDDKELKSYVQILLIKLQDE